MATKKFINGYSNPTFNIYTNSTLTDTINLNLCNGDGLVETYQLQGLSHTLLNYSTVTKWKGVLVTFNLSYKEWSDKENSFKIMNLLNYIINNKTIILIPRSDTPQRYFEVIHTGDSIDLGIMRGGLSASGNKLLSLSFKTKQLQPTIFWTNPDSSIYQGTDDFITIN